jgi:hypothetical protein
MPRTLRKTIESEPTVIIAEFNDLPTGTLPLRRRPWPKTPSFHSRTPLPTKMIWAPSATSGSRQSDQLGQCAVTEHHLKTYGKTL